MGTACLGEAEKSAFSFCVKNASHKADVPGAKGAPSGGNWVLRVEDLRTAALDTPELHVLSHERCRT